MSQTTHQQVTKSIVGEPEVLEDTTRAAGVEHSPAWRDLKAAATEIQSLQVRDGSIPDAGAHEAAAALVERMVAGVEALAPAFPHEDAYLRAAVVDLRRWREESFGVPDFLDALTAFQPQQHRVDGLRHLVLFPMVTQNGSPDRHVEALIVENIWPESVAALEEEQYTNALFCALRRFRSQAGRNPPRPDTATAAAPASPAAVARSAHWRPSSPTIAGPMSLLCESG